MKYKIGMIRCWDWVKTKSCLIQICFLNISSCLHNFISWLKSLKRECASYQFISYILSLAITMWDVFSSEFAISLSPQRSSDLDCMLTESWLTHQIYCHFQKTQSHVKFILRERKHAHVEEHRILLAEHSLLLSKNSEKQNSHKLSSVNV